MSLTPVQPSPDWNLVEVRLRARYLNGKPARGSITAKPQLRRFLDDDTVNPFLIVGSEISDDFNKDGLAVLHLPATNDPDITPNGFTFTITENIVGSPVTSYEIEVPLEKQASGIELSRVQVISPSDGQIIWTKGLILHGDGPPGAMIGGISDYYIDDENHALYGPKTTHSGWGQPYLLASASEVLAARDRAEDAADLAVAISGIEDTDDAIDAALKIPGGKAASTLNAAIGDKIVADVPEVAAVKGVIAHAARINDVKRLKGGKIGVQGKGVISFREDHGFDRFRDIHFPLMRARGISSGFGFVTGSIGNLAATYEPGTYGWGAARRIVGQGHEVWDHSRDHADPAPLGSSPYTVEQQIDGSRALMEAQELVPVGWQMPGVSGALTPGWEGGPADLTALGNTEAGQRMMANYGLIEAYRSGTVRMLPTDGCYLLSHATLDTMTLANAKAWVDRAVPGKGVELMFHPHWLGTAGFMSIADFTALLDYVVAKRDSGAIEVLTPSGLAFADPTTTYRWSWIADGGFEGVGVVGSKIGAWDLPSGAAGITVRTDGGRTGANYVRLDGTTANPVSQVFPDVLNGNLHGAAAEFRLWVRNTSANPQRIQMGAFISAPGGVSDFGIDNTVTTVVPAGTPWKQIVMPFVIPKNSFGAPVEALTFRFLAAPTGSYLGTLDVDDVQVHPI